MVIIFFLIFLYHGVGFRDQLVNLLKFNIDAHVQPDSFFCIPLLTSLHISMPIPTLNVSLDTAIQILQSVKSSSWQSLCTLSFQDFPSLLLHPKRHPISDILSLVSRMVIIRKKDKIKMFIDQTNFNWNIITRHSNKCYISEYITSDVVSNLDNILQS